MWKLSVKHQTWVINIFLHYLFVLIRRHLLRSINWEKSHLIYVVEISSDYGMHLLKRLFLSNRFTCIARGQLEKLKKYYNDILIFHNSSKNNTNYNSANFKSLSYINFIYLEVNKLVSSTEKYKRQGNRKAISTTVNKKVTSREF